MSWAYGITAKGTEAGYSVPDVCWHEGCTKEIDRGLAYVCGGEHDGGDHGCGGYFCSAHLAFSFRGCNEQEMSPQLCPKCVIEFEERS